MKTLYNRTENIGTRFEGGDNIGLGGERGEKIGAVSKNIGRRFEGGDNTGARGERGERESENGARLRVKICRGVMTGVGQSIKAEEKYLKPKTQLTCHLQNLMII